MHRWTTAAGWTSALVLAVGTTAGCGGGGASPTGEPASNGIAEMEPAEVLSTALEANDALDDVVYTGRMGVFLGAVSHAFDTRIAVSGDACSVEFTSSADGAISVLIVDGSLYVRGDDQALTEVFELKPSEIDFVDGRWMAGDGEPTSELTDLCAPAPVISTEIDETTCLPGGEEDVDGTPTVGVRCRRVTTEQTIYVAASGDPLVLRMEGQTIAGHYELTLEDSDTGSTITAPPDDEVIDNRALL